MRPADDIKRLIDKAQVTASSQVERRILGDALADLEQRRADRLARRPGVWRRVMRTRTAKLAAAAVIIAVILISIPHVNDNVVKAVEFEEITQAMQRVPWMHATTSGYPKDMFAGEYWVGFEARIHAGKDSNGTIHLESEKDHKQFIYQPNKAVITVSYLDTMMVDVTSPATLVEGMCKLLKNMGATIVATMGEFKGQRAQVQVLTLHTPSPGLDGTQTKELALYINPDSKLLYAAKVSGADPNGKVIMAGELTFDYPQTGPQSIYDLGVPRDARIEGDQPGAGVQSLLNQYERARAEATTEYIAIMGMREVPSYVGDDGVTTVEVDFKSGRQRRWESHSIFQGRQTAEVRAQYRRQLGESFDTLLAWTRRHYDNSNTYLSIMCYDGQYYASVDRDGKGTWGKLKKEYSPGGFDTNLTLSHQAWPPIDRAAQIIEDDYARQNGWICLEILNQGLVKPNWWAPLPKRLLYYLDPSRDYLCRRHVMEQRRDASWQKDKNWLADVDPKKVPEDSTTIIDIPEVAQAPNGYWYPQTLIQSQSGFSRDKKPVQETLIRKVYLQVAPKFPDGIFDVDKLPGQ